MASVLGPGVRSRRVVDLDDERLAALVRSGDEGAFEVLYARHHASLLAFCRRILGNRQDGEDALQEAFVRAHRALRTGRPPDAVRPWLFAIARNRCRTMLAARREAAMPIDELQLGVDGLAGDVRRRADLRELVADLGRLPDDQRKAMVLSEFGDLSHAEIAATIGCPTGKVKALVFQARTTLIAERDARGAPCREIREQLEVARGGVLRRGPLRRHVRQCEPCRAYGGAIARQRAALACLPGKRAAPPASGQPSPRPGGQSDDRSTRTAPADLRRARAGRRGQPGACLPDPIAHTTDRDGQGLLIAPHPANLRRGARVIPPRQPPREAEPMFDVNLKHSLATVAVAIAAGLLAAAGPASAGTHDADVVAYNGHAGLGASVYQHNQTDLEFLAAGVKDGTSNTISFGERTATPTGFSIDIGTSEKIAADGLGAD